VIFSSPTGRALHPGEPRRARRQDRTAFHPRGGGGAADLNKLGNRADATPRGGPQDFNFLQVEEYLVPNMLFGVVQSHMTSTRSGPSVPGPDSGPRLKSMAQHSVALAQTLGRTAGQHFQQSPMCRRPPAMSAGPGVRPGGTGVWRRGCGGLKNSKSRWAVDLLGSCGA
jgi:hypothetical protein